MELGEFLLTLALILICSRVLSGLCSQLRIPSVVGELLCGILLGGSFLAWVEPSSELHLIAELGLILLLFEAGLDSRPRRLVEAGPGALRVGFIGVIVPLVSGYFCGIYLLKLPPLAAFCVACALSATSIGIAIRAMKQLHLGDVSLRAYVLGAAVLDDAIGILLLSQVYHLAYTSRPDWGETLVLTTQVVAMILAGPPLIRILVWGLRCLGQWWGSKGIAETGATVLMLLSAWLSNLLGIPTILGAFVAGLGVSRHFIWFGPMKGRFPSLVGLPRRMEQGLKPMVTVFSPFFFVSIGLELDLASLAGQPLSFWLTTATLCLVAVLSKLAAGLGAPVNNHSKLLIGLAMVPRGEVGLIFISLGYQMGLLQDDLFNQMVLVMMLTSILGPLMLRLALIPPVEEVACSKG